jgi:hypothetical protein
MLFQAIIGACLEIPEYFSIGPLNLPIALWMCDRRIIDLDAEVFAVLFKHSTGTLGPIVCDDPVRDPNLQKIDLINLTADCLLIMTTRVAFIHFVNLSTATYKYRYPLMALGNGLRMSSPHMGKGHEGGNICSIYAGV